MWSGGKRQRKCCLVLDSRISQIFLKTTSNHHHVGKNFEDLSLDCTLEKCPEHDAQASILSLFVHILFSSFAVTKNIISRDQIHIFIIHPCTTLLYTIQHTIIKFIVLCFMYHCCRFILYKLCIYLSSGSSFLLKR